MPLTFNDSFSPFVAWMESFKMADDISLNLVALWVLSYESIRDINKHSTTWFKHNVQKVAFKPYQYIPLILTREFRLFSKITIPNVVDVIRSFGSTFLMGV